jgi:hypothetical protein
MFLGCRLGYLTQLLPRLGEIGGHYHRLNNGD